MKAQDPAPQEQQQQQQKQNNKEYTEHFSFYPWVCKQGMLDGISAMQQLVYQWLFSRNNIVKLRRKPGDTRPAIYSKLTYTDLWNEISLKFGFSRVDNLCDALENKGWIRKMKGEPFKGHPTVGYICMKSEGSYAAVREAKQQEMELQADDSAPVESSAQGNAAHGERYDYGQRYYEDATGRHTVPMDAPARPSDTAAWDNNSRQWREPESSTVRDGMFHLGRQHWYHIDPDGPDTEGNRQYVPEQFAFNRPSTAHIFDTEGQRWCLPGEETIPPMEF